MNDGGLIICAVFAAVVALPLLWCVFTYNSLVRCRTACAEAWATIDTELRRRYDLIPNLVETVKGYAKHERESLEAVTSARNAAVHNHGSPTAQARDENALIGSLRHLLAVAEAYPQLKADQHFLALQGELVNTEDRIQRARRFHNGNVRELNTKIEVFPSNLIAGMFRFEQREYFEIDEAVMRQPPAVRVGA